MQKLGAGCSLRNKQFDCRVVEVEDEDSLNDISLYNSAWVVSAGLVGQGGDSLPKCPSGRFLLLSWWFFVMILISLYMANLTAYLTLKRVGIPIDNIQDLLEQKELSWGVITDRITQARLLNHVDNTYAKIAEHGEQLVNLADAIERVKRGGFVFIDEGSVLDYNFRGLCNLVKFANEIQSSEWAFGLHKHSPYKSVINQFLLRYREEEYFTYLKKLWYEGDSGCGGQSVGNDTPFNMQTLLGLFYTLAIAVLICLVLVFCEFIHAGVQDSRRSTEESLCLVLKRRLKHKLRDIYHEWLGCYGTGRRRSQSVIEVDSIDINGNQKPNLHSHVHANKNSDLV